jgi:hypothetical protein
MLVNFMSYYAKSARQVDRQLRSVPCRSEVVAVRDWWLGLERRAAARRRGRTTREREVAARVLELPAPRGKPSNVITLCLILSTGITTPIYG